jgi:hypothetical protein
MSDPAFIAGERYHLATQTIRGDGISILTAHITWMLGHHEWHRPVWRDRVVPPDGQTFQTASFDQYLLFPPPEGLGLPSLLLVHKMCEADPLDGVRAIAMLRREIRDYDARVNGGSTQLEQAVAAYRALSDAERVAFLAEIKD